MPASHAVETLAEDGADLVELYFERGWTDGLPVVPPTREKIDAVVEALGGEPDFVECKLAPRWGVATREVIAINMVMAGCIPAYAPVVRAALLAITDPAFNLNGGRERLRLRQPRQCDDRARGMEGLVAVVIDHPVSSITMEEVAQRVVQIEAQAPAVWLGRAG